MPLFLEVGVAETHSPKHQKFTTQVDTWLCENVLESDSTQVNHVNQIKVQLHQEEM